MPTIQLLFLVASSVVHDVLAQPQIEDPTIPELPIVGRPGTSNDPYTPLSAVNWDTIDLFAQINEKYSDPSNGYDAGDGVLGLDSVGFEVRTYDATGNNLANPGWGATFSQAVRCVPHAYADGISALNGQSRMNPREISNVIAKQSPESDPKFVNNRHLTQLTWQWGQFIDHDVTLISEATFHEIGPEAEHIDVYVPCNDPEFDDDSSDPAWCDADRHLEIVRTHEFPGTGTSVDNPRQQQNELTSFVDASMIYGSDEARARALRKFQGGKLLLDDDDYFGFLPDNSDAQPNEPNSDETFVLAGDVRPNEQLGLLTMHTIWVRFHNMVADDVAESLRRRALGKSRLEFDEAVYQYTKLIVTAIVQKITYKDWLPIMFGPTAIRQFLGEYTGYDDQVNGGACLIFSSAAYRLGHTLLPNFLPLRNADCSFWTDFDPVNCPQCDLTLGGIELRNSFFVPQIAEDNDGFFEALLNGFSCTLANEIDVSITEGVRSFLFESAIFPLETGERIFGDLDLIALNLQRAREHGLPDYNSVREQIGLRKLNDFSEFEELVGDADLADTFREVYNDDVNDMDLFLALLAEEHFEDGSFGETISAIVLQQFARFRDGDRFWYQDYIKPGELLDFIESVTLKSVIEMTTDIDNIGSLDSIRHNIFQNSRAVPIFSGDNAFDEDVYFAKQEAQKADQAQQAAEAPMHVHETEYSHHAHKQYRPPMAKDVLPRKEHMPSSSPRNASPYVIEMTNFQILVIFGGIIAVICCTCFMMHLMRRSRQKSYRPVKYDTESEYDASDLEKLQS